MSSIRSVLAHGHIFKNAGSTLDWALKRSFGKKFLDHRDDQPMRFQGAAYLGQYLDAHPKLAALSSHHLCSPLPASTSMRVLPLYLLRNPIERVLSVYEFERRQRGKTPGAINAKKMDISDYVRWRLTPDSGATVRNYQVRYLNGLHRFSYLGMTDADYQGALDRINAGIRVGLVEKLAESFVQFECSLQMYPEFASLDLSFIPQNVNQSRAFSQEERIDELRQRLGSDLFGELADANRFDIKLYQQVQAILADRCDSIRDFGEKVDSFRSRCAALG